MVIVRCIVFGIKAVRGTPQRVRWETDSVLDALVTIIMTMRLSNTSAMLRRMRSMRMSRGCRTIPALHALDEAAQHGDDG